MIRKLCNKATNKSLNHIALDVSLKNVRDFTSSNPNGVLDEIGRYQRMAKYFRESLHPKKIENSGEYIPLSIDRRTKENDKYIQLILYRTGTLCASLWEKLTDEQRKAGFKTEEMQECEETLDDISYCLSGDTL